MVTATIEEQLAKATEAEQALSAEIEAMEAQQRGHSLDAMSDARIRQQMLTLDQDIESKKRGLALVRAAHEEGQRRLAARADAEAQQQRVEREAERARIANERDATLYAFEEMIARIVSIITTAKNQDGVLRNLELRLDEPAGRLARDAMSTYAHHHLFRAGLSFDQPYRERGGVPISHRRQGEERQAAEAAQRAADEARQAVADAEHERQEAEHAAALAEQEAADERTQE